MVAVLKSLSWDWASSKEDAMIDVFFFPPLCLFWPNMAGIVQVHHRNYIGRRKTLERRWCPRRPAAGSLSSGKPALGGTKAIVFLFQEHRVGWATSVNKLGLSWSQVPLS